MARRTNRRTRVRIICVGPSPGPGRAAFGRGCIRSAELCTCAFQPARCAEEPHINNTVISTPPPLWTEDAHTPRRARLTTSSETAKTKMQEVKKQKAKSKMKIENALHQHHQASAIRHHEARDTVISGSATTKQQVRASTKHVETHDLKRSPRHGDRGRRGPATASATGDRATAGTRRRGQGAPTCHTN